MTIIGVDYGEKNIGTAVAFLDMHATRPLEVIRHSKDFREIDRIIEIANEWDAEKLIVGVSLTKSGDETQSSQQARSFAKKLEKSLVDASREILDVEFFNEANSTRQSEKGLTRRQKRKRGDAFAAEYILKQYLLAHANMS
jgi:putative Holliday junction resolvase